MNCKNYLFYIPGDTESEYTIKKLISTKFIHLITQQIKVLPGVSLPVPPGTHFPCIVSEQFDTIIQGYSDISMWIKFLMKKMQEGNQNPSDNITSRSTASMGNMELSTTISGEKPLDGGLLTQNPGNNLIGDCTLGLGIDDSQLEAMAEQRRRKEQSSSRD